MSIEKAKICPDCGVVVVPSMVLTGDEDFGMLAADECEAFDQHICYEEAILDVGIEKACDALTSDAERHCPH